MHLFELTGQYLAAMEALRALDVTNDEEMAVFADTLEGMTGELDDKILNTAAILKNFQAEVDAVRKHETDVIHRRRMLEHKIDRIKGHLMQCMQATHRLTVSDARLSVRVQNSKPLVIIDDLNLLPPDFLSVETITNAKKPELYAALKDAPVPGAHLQPQHRLVIK